MGEEPDHVAGKLALGLSTSSLTQSMFCAVHALPVSAGAHILPAARCVKDMLDNWVKCQSTWLYLEPIFSSDDIVKQMPEEGEKFRQVDTMWRAMQKSTNENPNAIRIAQDEERLDNLVGSRLQHRLHSHWLVAQPGLSGGGRQAD